MSTMNQPSSQPAGSNEVVVDKEQLGDVASTMLEILRTRMLYLTDPTYMANLSMDDLTFSLDKKIWRDPKGKFATMRINDGKGPHTFFVNLETGSLGGKFEVESDAA